MECDWSESVLASSHAMIAQVRDVPNEPSGFLIRLSERGHWIESRFRHVLTHCVKRLVNCGTIYARSV